MKSVLIIDKERSIRKALTLFLSRQGYITTGAESLSEAEPLLKNNTYDTIIADVPLGDVNAVKFYGKMNNSEETNYIFTSAFPERMPSADAIKIKEASFLEKPFTLSRLSEMLAPRYGEDMAIAV